MPSQNPPDFFSHRRELAGIPDDTDTLELQRELDLRRARLSAVAHLPPRGDARTPCGVLVSGRSLDAFGFPRSETPFVTCANSACVPCRAAEARARVTV